MPRTELVDLAAPIEKAFLIAVDTGDDRGWPAEESLQELAALADTAGADVVGAEWQNRRHVDPNWYLGKGKAEELVEAKAETGFTLLVADDELSPNQQKALETLLKIKVLDRSGLILDIFAQRARSREGKLQVELAQLRHRQSNLIGSNEALSRLGGGVGTRGPGETKLEVDRRKIGGRIAVLREQLENVRRSRATRRSPQGDAPLVALVGYTNVGKSSLLNRLTDAGVLVENSLFATLDPTVRRAETPDGMPYTLADTFVRLSDTVGFITELPKELLNAFRATLEELEGADVLVHVIDASNPDWPRQRASVDAILQELGVDAKPTLLAFNKADVPRDPTDPPLPSDALAISAKTGAGLDELRAAIVASIVKSA